MLAFAIGDVTGITLTIARDAHVPLWIWVVIPLVGLLVAQFLVFHKIRVERDELKMQLSKPVLFIRGSGFSRLAKDYTQEFQRFAMWYEIIISNPSDSLRLGIQKIVLTWEKAKDERQINAFLPIFGDIDIGEDERELSIKGEINSSFNLEPNEVKAGKLVFIVEENRLLAIGEYSSEVIRITDNRGNTFRYEAMVNDILS